MKLSLILLMLPNLSIAAESALCVGFGEADVSPRIDGKKKVYMAGFGHDREAIALHDPIMARAVVLAHGEHRIALVCVDVVGLFLPFVDKVRSQLNGYDYVLVSSSHNHEGPDTLGLWGPNIFQSGIDPDYMKQLTEGIVHAVRDADKSAQEVTAEFASLGAPQLLNDSRLPIVLHEDLVALRFTSTSSKKRVGVLMQWNCHPETMGSKNTKLTADFVGYTVKELTNRQECPVAYFTGTVGGLMSSLKVPLKNEKGVVLADDTFEKTEEFGRRVAMIADKALQSATKVQLTPFQICKKDLYLPVDNKLYRAGWQGGVVQRPVYIANAKGGWDEHTVDKELPPNLMLRTEVGLLHLGELDVAVIPGEIYPELVLSKVQDPVDPGADFPDAPIEPGIYAQMKAKHKMIIGLGNDELGYIIPKRQWDEKAPFCYGLPKAQYGEINSLGPDTAPKICKCFEELAVGKK